MSGFLCATFTSGQHSVGGFQSITSTPFVSTTGKGSVTSASFSASHLGGPSAYTYSWSEVKGSPGIGISSPTSSSTTATATLNPADLLTGFFICTVTDGASTVVKSNQITLQFKYG